MAKSYRYCWLKMVEVTVETPVRTDTHCSGLGAWAIAGGGVSLYAAVPDSATSGIIPAITPAPAPPSRDKLIIYSGCRPCPAVAPPDRFKVAMGSGVEPQISTSVPCTGWQIEGAPIEDAIAGTTDQPRVFFAVQPVEGNRDAAIRWLESEAGREWLKDSSTCVLLSTFEVT